MLPKPKVDKTHSVDKHSSDKHSSKLYNRLNVELTLTTAWQQQAWWLWLLLPLSWLYSLISFWRRKLYQLNVLPSYRAPIPVMIVGNITVGGSGKTPLIIALVNYLQAQQVKVGVISRGYGGDEALMPCVVTRTSLPSAVGDEPCLIVRQTGVMMSVCPNRQLAIECLLQHAPDTKLIIADDGLQHYKLARDIEWIVVDTMRGFGNKQRLPAGYLREPLSRLKKATVVQHKPINTVDNSNSELLTMVLKPASFKLLTALSANQPNSQPVLKEQPIRQISKQTLNPQQKIYAVSGIGYPQRFFNTLSQLGFEVIEHPMPDHHEFTAKDLLHLNLYPIVITAKDAVKIAPLIDNDTRLAQLKIWVLPVQAVLSPNCYQTLKAQLKAQGVLVKD